MARTPKKTAEVIDLDDKHIDTGKTAGALAQLRADAAGTELARTEQDERVAALARQLNYAGSTDPDVLENSAKDAIRRMGMTAFELGAYLLLLNEACPRGHFLPLLERLSMAPRAAQRYMAITRRFANASTSTHLEAAGFSKMVELLPLDDEQIEALTEHGQTGELDLDDVTRMSVKELRAAVRKERAQAAKNLSRAERQEAVNAELHEELQVIRRMPPSEELKRVHAAATELQAELQGHLQGAYRQVLIALNNAEADQTLLMAGMVAQLQSDLAQLRDEFSLPAVDATPEWEAWAQQQPSAAKTTGKAATKN